MVSGGSPHLCLAYPCTSCLLPGGIPCVFGEGMAGVGGDSSVPIKVTLPFPQFFSLLGAGGGGAVRRLLPGADGQPPPTLLSESPSPAWAICCQEPPLLSLPPPTPAPPARADHLLRRLQQLRRPSSPPPRTHTQTHTTSQPPGSLRSAPSNLAFLLMGLNAPASCFAKPTGLGGSRGAWAARSRSPVPAWRPRPQS